MGFRDAVWIPLLALLPACDEPVAADEERAWPEGTVVAVDDIPISLDEVDVASVWIERIDPKASSPQLRRLALANVSLPRAVAQAMAPEAHALAKREAEAALKALREGTYEGPPHPEVADGNFQELSIAVWGLATDNPTDEWSGPVDDVGQFVVYRVLERQDMPHTAALRVKIEVVGFPYLGEDDDVEAAKDRHRLTIVDPAWREIVPERTQYRMGARTP